MEEPELKKRKTEEEIRREVREEIQKENEIKEIKANTKRSIIAIFLRIIFVLILICFIVLTALGVLNMNKMSEDKEPVWCFKQETKNENGKKEKICDLGLYVVIRSIQGNETQTSLKPFFLK